MLLSSELVETEEAPAGCGVAIVERATAGGQAKFHESRPPEQLEKFSILNREI